MSSANQGHGYMSDILSEQIHTAVLLYMSEVGAQAPVTASFCAGRQVYPSHSGVVPKVTLHIGFTNPGVHKRVESNAATCLNNAPVVHVPVEMHTATHQRHLDGSA